MNREERHEDEAPADPFGGVPVCLRGALERRGFSSLTSVQRRILENHTRGRNLRISSQTGSGKTVALGIALAETLERDPERRRAGPIALIVTPTRELAAQVSGELTWLFEDMKRVRVLVVTGGTSVLHEQRALKARPQVLVGTPGRLLDHLNSKSLDCADLEEVVLDEADQMLDMGFKDELDAIVDALPAARRSHLVSATFPREVVTLADRFAPDALSIEGTALGAAHLDIIHVANVLRRHDQYAALVNNLLMLGAGKSLIFVRTRADAAEVAELLGRDGFSALPLSGDLPQAQRTRTMNAFRHGTVRTLVATDVAARGIDVSDIAAVIHLGIPNNGSVYTHRSGRTGRAGNKGKSITLVPFPAERRMRQIFSEAKVKVDWRSAPSPEVVKKFSRKRFRRSLHKLIERAAEDPEVLEHLDYARGLIEKYDSALLVAQLLELANPKLVREPLPITPPRSRRSSFDSNERTARRGGHERGHGSRRRERSGYPPRRDYVPGGGPSSSRRRAPTGTGRRPPRGGVKRGITKLGSKKASGLK